MGPRVGARDGAWSPPLRAAGSLDGYWCGRGRTTEHARALARADPRAVARAPTCAVLGSFEPPAALLGVLERARRQLPRGRDSPWCLATAGDRDQPRAASPTCCAPSTRAPTTSSRGPARYLELRARLRALLRRAGAGGRGERSEVGPLAIDPRRPRGAPPRRSRSGCGAWSTSCSCTSPASPSACSPRQELLRAVWGYRSPAPRARSTPTPAACGAGSARRAHERWVVSVRGVGYRLI